MDLFAIFDRVLRACWDPIRSVFSPVEVDEKILDQALGSTIKDFEDAIQYFSALRARASYLITRNPGDFPEQSPLPVLTSEMFNALELFGSE